ncbi:MAG: hypothetical protein EZS28_053682, partial [Streblomastix strix]
MSIAPLPPQLTGYAEILEGHSRLFERLFRIILIRDSVFLAKCLENLSFSIRIHSAIDDRIIALSYKEMEIPGMVLFLLFSASLDYHHHVLSYCVRRQYVVPRNYSKLVHFPSKTFAQAVKADDYDAESAVIASPYCLPFSILFFLQLYFDLNFISSPPVFRGLLVDPLSVSVAKILPHAHIYSN